MLDAVNRSRLILSRSRTPFRLSNPSISSFTLVVGDFVYDVEPSIRKGPGCWYWSVYPIFIPCKCSLRIGTRVVLVYFILSPLRGFPLRYPYGLQMTSGVHDVDYQYVLFKNIKKSLPEWDKWVRPPGTTVVSSDSEVWGPKIVRRTETEGSSTPIPRVVVRVVVHSLEFEPYSSYSFIQGRFNVSWDFEVGRDGLCTV